MRHLRHLSTRPELVVDGRARRIFEQPERTVVGRPAPFGRARVIFALPLDPGPVQLAAPTVVHDEDGAHLADPDGNLVGRAAVWVPRMLAARWTEDTRRIAG